MRSSRRTPEVVQFRLDKQAQRFVNGLLRLQHDGARLKRLGALLREKGADLGLQGKV